ncbi:type VI secretion system tube protein TssD [Pseudomonas aeruginosa]|uniref:type VI secretion system tube protein TssD n=1 Tax=Pseudomonas aeruginosa TaxID=287 RepID=UPI0010C2E001|nr:type VI secretion system tube protein TssD [Pseudomonas aeruginosa]QBN02818.1 secreted protein Hcp [Pseudomonas aeruginosa]
MATPAYMSITGTKQGLITAGAFTEDSVGNTYQEGHEDQVMVQGFNHEVIIPRDRSPASRRPARAQAGGHHQGLRQGLALLLAALTSGERLTKVEIQWYRTSAAGTQEHYYTTVLEDAIIVDIKDYMHNCRTRATPTSPTWKTCTSPTARSPGPRSLWHLRLRRLALAGAG